MLLPSGKALSLSVGGLFLCLWGAIFTAPMSLYVTVRHWKSPGSIIPRKKWRFVAAVVFSIISLVLLTAMLVLVFHSISKAEW